MSDDANNPQDPKENTVEAPQALAPLDFCTYILSLASSAMVTMGKVPAPGESESHADLIAAKQIIDILGILEEKTKNNLSTAEEKLLSSVLYDLRIQFVDANATKPA